MAKAASEPGFAPNDPTDSRDLFEWQSRYPADAKKQIRVEVACVVGALFLVPVLLFIVWQGFPRPLLALDEQRYPTFARYCYAWLGGTLGGTLFDLKWLYHSVARGIWHLDRRLWRMLIPHISGGLAFAVIVLVSSGMFRIFDPVELSRPPVVFGVSFLVGYFSDRAIGKLAEIADTLFGATGAKRYPDEKGPKLAQAKERTTPSSPQ